MVWMHRILAYFMPEQFVIYGYKGIKRYKIETDKGGWCILNLRSRRQDEDCNILENGLLHICTKVAEVRRANG